MLAAFERHRLGTSALLVAWIVWVLNAVHAVPYDNQNSYLLKGIAASGEGALTSDWLANQVSPFPLFDGLITALAALPGPWERAVDWAYLPLIVLAFVSLGKLASWRNETGGAMAIAVFALLVIVPVEPLSTVLTRGVATQYVFGPGLQPSEFGILLLSGLAAYQAGFRVLAFAVVAAAGAVHPSYLLPAALLVAGMAGLAWSERRGQARVVLACSLAFLTVLPSLIHSWVEFLSAPIGVRTEAAEFLAFERIPHHAVPAIWFDGTSLVQVAWVAAGVWLAWWREHPMALPLAVLAAGCLVASVAVSLSSEATLLLLFPWRATALLVPIATVLIFASLFEAASRSPSLAAGASAAVAFAVVTSSAAEAERTYAGEYVDPEAIEMVAFLETAPAGVVIQSPRQFQSLRLRTGQPVWADWKSHPYAAEAVLEWRDRIVLAQTVFDPETKCTERAAALRASDARWLLWRAMDGIQAERPVPAKCLEAHALRLEPRFVGHFVGLWEVVGDHRAQSAS